MPPVNVTITGADEAKFNWDGNYRTLTSTGKGKWEGGFNAVSGDHEYFVEVSGQPKDPWRSEVADGTSSDTVKGRVKSDGHGNSGHGLSVSCRALAIAAAFLLVVTSARAADDKKKAGGDQTQSLIRPSLSWVARP